ncbi:hypothetical protein ZIOFF_056843 [Zingiber officinale]|uniref:Uncharacterized protein n=1 Tax=Zingiber officinale TaxID=94328 RepID=A0A8J5FIH7_ZINOF|nr:hypothetical protein ZIOFF_056843 [Zingiber officinale]
MTLLVTIENWAALSSWLLLLLFPVWALAEALNVLWWRPWRMERALREQGLTGTAYRFLYGDLKEMRRFLMEAVSKPMPLSHDIALRVAPFIAHKIREFGPVPRVALLEPELVKEVFVKKFDQVARPGLSAYQRYFVTGIFSYEGEKWSKHRKMLNPAFHLEKLKQMLPVFCSCCTDMVEKWEGMVGPEGSFQVDVWPELQDFTADVISRTAFGSNYKEGRKIFQLQTEQTELILLALQSVYIPGFRFLPTPKNNRRKAIHREARSILIGIIRKREEAMKKGEPTKQDLLGLMLESSSKHAQETGEKNAGMTYEDVIEECKLFYFAGQETTSILITTTMIVLSMHPDWQVKAREEVLQLFGKDKPEYNELSSLKIMTMILYEVLRLYPPVPVLERRTFKPVQIGSLLIPSGAVLVLPTVLIHRDPSNWGDDAEEFNPMRFSQGVSMALKEQYAFFPFGGGPRICIGQNFAMLEAKMALSVILQRFSFEFSASYAHAPTRRFTLQPQHGVPLKLHRLGTT